MGLYRKEITTPCGLLTLLCDGRALVAIRFGREADGTATGGTATATTGTMQACPGAETRKKEIPAQEVQTAQEVLAQAAREIGEYFEGERRVFTVPTAAAGTPFQQAVWNALKKIPYGETTTYGAIAQQLAEQRGGARVSARAVGGAVGHNPISVIVPCHRVVGANGSLTGYAGGIERKVRLLELEGTNTCGLFVPTRG